MNPSKKKIIVVDDDLTILKLIQRALGSLYELVVAPTGYDLELMIHHFTPDLIILDLAMPDENGKDISAALRKHQEYDAMAILLLSGLDEPKVAAAALEGGADGYMTKPFDVHTLQTTIAFLIDSKHRAAGRTAHPTSAH